MTEAKSGTRDLILRFVAPATITTALLYYFGWIRSREISNAFGYDPSLLGLGTQDYILRSVQPMIVPLVGGTVVGAAWWGLHRDAEKHLLEGHFAWLHNRWLASALSILGTGLVIYLIVRLYQGGEELIARSSYIIPLLFLLGAALVGYGAWLRSFASERLEADRTGSPSDDADEGATEDVGLEASGAEMGAMSAEESADEEKPRVDGDQSGSEDGDGSYGRLPSHVGLIVVTFVLVAAFLATATYARSMGREQAERNIANVETAAHASIISADPLALEGVPVRHAGDHYVYSGLVLMFSENGRHFLLPTTYSSVSNARLYTVNAASVRIDFDNSYVMPCSGFEDLEPGQTIEPGSSFSSAGITYEVAALPDRDMSIDPELMIVDANPGVELRLRGVEVAPVLDGPYEQLIFEYDMKELGVSVNVNGAEFDSQTISSLDDGLGTVARFEADEGGSGRFAIKQAADPLFLVSFGGNNLVIDCVPNVPILPVGVDE